MQSDKADSSFCFLVTTLFAVSGGVKMEFFSLSMALARERHFLQGPHLRTSILSTMSHEQSCGLIHLERASAFPCLGPEVHPEETKQHAVNEESCNEEAIGQPVPRNSVWDVPSDIGSDGNSSSDEQE